MHLVSTNITSITNCEFNDNFEKGLAIDHLSCNNVVTGGYVHGNSLTSAGSYVGILNQGAYNKFIGVDFNGLAEVAASKCN